MIDYPRFERRDACGHHAAVAVQLPECQLGSFRNGLVRIHQRHEIVKPVDAFWNSEADIHAWPGDRVRPPPRRLGWPVTTALAWSTEAPHVMAFLGSAEEGRFFVPA